MILSQVPPGFDDVISAAAQSGRGWEAVALAIIVMGGFTGAAIMFRYYAQQAVAREEKLSSRIEHLEDLINTRLFSTIDSSASLMQTMLEQSERLGRACDRIVDTMERFDAILSSRPCVAMEAIERMRMVDAIVQHPGPSSSQKS